jgi:hypothetical protein
MNVQPATDAVGLPAVNSASEPAWVRQGSKSVKGDYQAALAFEGTLIEQLSKALVATSGLPAQGEPSEEEAGSSEEAAPGAQASSGLLSSLLPQALAGGVVDAGGLGLAAQLTRELAGVGNASQPAAGGGTPASPTAAGQDTAQSTGGVGA